jgi:hypothetical protein
MVTKTNTAKNQKEQRNTANFKKKDGKGLFFEFREIYFWPIKILRLKKHKCREALVRFCKVNKQLL